MEAGTYHIKVKAKDPYDAESEWSDSLTINISDPPDIPDIDGPNSGKVGVTYNYTFVTSDPNGEDVYYYIDWDDGQKEEWIGPYSSGKKITVKHKYDSMGDYGIRAKAKDINDQESGWAELEVTMPRNKISHNSLFLKFLGRLMNRFPLIERLLNLL